VTSSSPFFTALPPAAVPVSGVAPAPPAAWTAWGAKPVLSTKPSWIAARHATAPLP
jgi:hypothetical protein